MKRITSFLLAMVLFAGLVLTGAPVTYAASDMTASDEIIDMIKKEEGFAAKPYWDYSQYTVGYGTRCPDDMLEEYKENGITKEAAEVLLRNYIAGTENAINKKLIDKKKLNLTQAQFDALVSFTYNCGSGWMSDTSGIFYNAIVKGATGSELIHAFLLWCSAGGEILPGLIKRRLSEANMYLNGVYSRTPPENFCYVYLNANGGSVKHRIQGYEASEGTKPSYTPTYSGHTFQGWYTATSGGTKVTKLTKKLSGTTLYARWKDADGNETTNTIDPVTVTVTANDVNLRKGPGTNYGKAGQVDKGEKLTITEVVTATGYTWGKAGDVWIALKYTNYDTVKKEQEKETTAPTTAPTTPETTVPETTVPETTEPAVTKVTGKVKASGGLAVRKGPGTGYAKIKYLKNGTKVTILEQKKVGSTTWGKISSGWISMKYVVLDKTQTTTPTTTAPETTAPETTVPETTVPETTVPETTVPETTVPETTVPETTVPETTVPETTVPETTVPETTAPKETVPETTKPASTKLTGKVKASGGLAVRKGAGSNYAIKKYLKNGTKVTITETKTVKGVKWGYMGSGWISMSYVTLDKQTTTETTKVVKTVNTACLRVRASASTSSKIVGYYYRGDKVTIQQTKKVGSTTWGKTSKGWISMQYVK